MSEHLLPTVLVLTDRRQAAAAGHDLASMVASFRGLDVAVLFREKDLPRADRVVLGQAVAAAARAAEVPLIVASDVDLAIALDAIGVHLGASDPPVEDAAMLVGRSCHDDAELRAARAENVASVTLSPAFETTSKPGYGPALGLDGLASLVASTSLPVYALGGVTATSIEPCLAAGASGVAVMGAVMRAEHPAEVVESLLRAVARSRIDTGASTVG